MSSARLLRCASIRPPVVLQMDYIAGSFYDGFVLYAKALEETLAEGGAQNDGINITMRTQNRQIWGEQMRFPICFVAQPLN